MFSHKGLSMLCMRYVILMILMNAITIHCQVERWSWFYAQIIQSQRVSSATTKKMTIFSKVEVPHFSQLIFSWNARRPSRGYFSFLIQTRNAVTKQWGKWHRMMDWGADVQRSYLSDGDGHTKYVHVRLEHQNNKKSDGFRIKICAHKNAGITDVKSVAVALSDYALFEPENVASLLKLPSVYISGVPKVSQLLLDHPDNKRLCSPTSCFMLTHYLCQQRVTPEIFADNVFDSGLEVFGSWPFNVAHAFELCGGSNWFFTKRLHNFVDIYRQLRRGLPVVVSVRGMIEGAPKAYENGHLLVVVGWDAKRKKVICHDPALPEHGRVLISYPVESFIRAWERSYRLAYWVEPVKL